MNDEECWKELFERYRRLVLAEALRSGLPADDADDVVQDVFVEVHRSFSDFEPSRRTGSFRSWLAQKTRWRIIDFQRRRGRRREDFREVVNETGTPPEEQIPAEPQLIDKWDREEQLFLRDLVARRVQMRVSARDFQIYELRMVQEVPASEVASRFGLKRANVDVVVHRVRNEMEAEMETLRRRLGL